jgi:glucose/arabinose dehydrogenase
MQRQAIAAAAALLLVPAELLAGTAQTFKTQKLTLSVETVADGLDHPWGMAFLPDGTILVTERRGRLLALKDGNASEVAGAPQVLASGQGGLLDLEIDPDFATSRRLYFTYSEPGPGGASTALGVARLSDDGTRLENVGRLWAMAKKTGTRLHYGSRIVFAPDGTMFVTTGDRGEKDRAQDFSDSAGAVIRLNRDGTVPADNPFVKSGKGLPELWSKGHRNIQGAAWDSTRNVLWTVEHGAMGGDEINAPEPSRNYGWPVISYGIDYSGAKIGVGTKAPGFEQPLFYWDPSIAPSGLAVVSGNLFAEWQGDLLVGALKYQLLARLEVRDGKIVAEERMLEGEFGRIRDVQQGPDGAIYLLTDEDDGQLLRLTPAGN